MPRFRGERGARLVNVAYERGWEDGWNAALARVEEIGLEEVRHREEELRASSQLPLRGSAEEAA